MDKKQLQDALTQLRKEENKKNFKQTVDLIYTFKGLDLKKTENQLNFSVILKHSKGKDVKLCAFVDAELKDTAKKNMDTVIMDEEFERYSKNKKSIKKLLDETEYFIAQANLMAQVATHFGKVLGPKGKMPNPKAGCVVPPNANLKPLADKLRQTVVIKVRTGPMVQMIVGKEDMKDDDIIDNILTLDEAIVHHLPGGRAQVKGIYLKLTMSKPVKL